MMKILIYWGPSTFGSPNVAIDLKLLSWHLLADLLLQLRLLQCANRLDLGLVGPGSSSNGFQE